MKLADVLGRLEGRAPARGVARSVIGMTLPTRKRPTAAKRSGAVDGATRCPTIPESPPEKKPLSRSARQCSKRWRKPRASVSAGSRNLGGACDAVVRWCRVRSGKNDAGGKPERRVRRVHLTVQRRPTFRALPDLRWHRQWEPKRHHVFRVWSKEKRICRVLR